MTKPTDNLKINGERLWGSIHEMAEIGPGVAGGNNRQTLTDDDARGRALFKTWCDEAGLTMGVDRMGTMFMRREGTDPDALPVYVGSHLDTQPTGGRYDGVLGVLSALELVRTLNDLDIKTKHPIVVTNWTNEEGARFAPAMLASGVFAGVHTLDYAYGRKDPEGKSFGDELKRIGWLGDEKVGARKMHAYFEYHIEQGPILEAENKQIGVVTHGQGLWWLEFTLTGKEAHTGSTPMSMRINAGLAMARILEMVQTVAMDNQPGAVGGVGQMFFYPQFAQRPSRQGGLHRRYPLARPGQARRHARPHRGGGAQDLRRARGRLLGRAGRPFRSGHLRSDARQARACRRRAARLHPPRHHLRRRPRCLLGGKRGARHHGHVSLRRRTVAQRGGADFQGVGEAGADVLLHAVLETAEIVG